jgi:hypothetical protein
MRCWTPLIISLCAWQAIVGCSSKDSATTPQRFADSGSIDFETPQLGPLEARKITPYVDTNSGISFSADNGDVGIVKNSATSSCVEPADEDQKLGTAPNGLKIGRGTLPIRATLPTSRCIDELTVEAQTLAGITLQLVLFDSARNEVGVIEQVANPPAGTCGFPGSPRARAMLSAQSDTPVASFVVSAVLGTSVVVIDNVQFQFSECGAVE